MAPGWGVWEDAARDAGQCEFVMRKRALILGALKVVTKPLWIACDLGCEGLQDVIVEGLGMTRPGKGREHLTIAVARVK